MPRASSSNDILEQQNDAQLDVLHSKLRNLKGVTIDIQGDVESQNRRLDESSTLFDSLQTGLRRSSKIGERVWGDARGHRGPIQQCKSILYIIGAVIALNVLYRIIMWFIWLWQKV